MSQTLAFVLDRSGSMNAPLVSSLPLSIASSSSLLPKKFVPSMWRVLVTVVSQLLETSVILDTVYDDVSALVFNNNSEVVLPPSPAVPETCQFLIERLYDINPSGRTAIYTSMRECIEMSIDSGNPTHIVLVTDGLDTDSTDKDRAFCQEKMSEMGVCDQLKIGVVAVLPKSLNNEMMKDIETTFATQAEYVFIDKSKFSLTKLLSAIRKVLGSFKETKASLKNTKGSMKNTILKKLFYNNMNSHHMSLLRQFVEQYRNSSKKSKQ